MSTTPQVIQVTWLPIVDDDTASHLIAESDHPFAVTVKHEAGALQQIPSEHDGIVHFVAVDVPETAEVEVNR